jgi:hypothetical protein
MIIFGEHNGTDDDEVFREPDYLKEVAQKIKDLVLPIILELVSPQGLPRSAPSTTKKLKN